MEEFEKIELEEKKAVNEKGAFGSTIEKAWDRIKSFMGTADENSTSAKKS